MAKVKVKLNCKFGDKMPNEVVDVESDVAEKLIGRGQASKVTQEKKGK